MDAYGFEKPIKGCYSNLVNFEFELWGDDDIDVVCLWLKVPPFVNAAFPTVIKPKIISPSHNHLLVSALDSYWPEAEIAYIDWGAMGMPLSTTMVGNIYHQ